MADTLEKKLHPIYSIKALILSHTVLGAILKCFGPAGTIHLDFRTGSEDKTLLFWLQQTNMAILSETLAYYRYFFLQSCSFTEPNYNQVYWSFYSSDNL